MDINGKQLHEEPSKLYDKLDRINRCAIAIKSDMMDICNFLFVIEDLTGNRPHMLSSTIENISRQATLIYSLSAGADEYGVEPDDVVV